MQNCKPLHQHYGYESIARESVYDDLALDLHVIFVIVPPSGNSFANYLGRDEVTCSICQMLNFKVL